MRTRPMLAVMLSMIAVVPGLAAQDRGEELLIEEQFDVRAGGTLRADLHDMDILVRSGGGDRAVVRVFARARDMAWAREVFDETDFRAVASGGSLRIEARDDRIDWREFRERGWVSFRAEVTVPTRYDLDLETGDGDIRLAEFEGSLQVQSGDGDVFVDRVSGSRVELRTGDGDITVGSIDAADIRLHTGDGDLDIRDLTGSVTAESGDGDVSLDFARFEGASIRTGDGDVHVTIPESSSADVELTGEDIDLARDMTISGRVRENRVSGSFNGGGPALQVRTGDGSIRIRTR